jgi:hypothetical protein
MNATCDDDGDGGCVRNDGLDESLRCCESTVSIYEEGGMHGDKRVPESEVLSDDITRLSCFGSIAQPLVDSVNQ